ncbi:helix-turn-helix domain-containing protein [Alsobacter sp. R-9]
MPHRLLALLVHDALTRARQDASLSPEDAAQRADIELEALVSWENGLARPSLDQLRRLAGAYDRTIGVFFLPQSPLCGGDGAPDLNRLRPAGSA